MVISENSDQTDQEETESPYDVLAEIENPANPQNPSEPDEGSAYEARRPVNIPSRKAFCVARPTVTLPSQAPKQPVES